MQITAGPFGHPTDSPGFLNVGGYYFMATATVAAVASQKSFAQLWYPATTFPGAVCVGFEIICGAASLFSLASNGSAVGTQNTTSVWALNNANFAPVTQFNTGAQVANLSDLLWAVSVQANTPYRNMPGFQYIYGGGFVFDFSIQCQTVNTAFQITYIFAEPPV